jgi:hypothetical protein
MLRSATLSTFWLCLAAFCVWIGLERAIELRFGEEALPTAIGSVASIIVVVWLVVPGARTRILGLSRSIAVSSLLAILGAWTVEIATDGFECQDSCFGVLNSALGYACGEWSRGCSAEWFLLFLVTFGMVINILFRLRPNPPLNTDAREETARAG